MANPPKTAYEFEQEGLPERVVVDHEYPVLDAGIYQALEELKIPFRRVQLTSGSARYILTETREGQKRTSVRGSFVVRALDADRTDPDRTQPNRTLITDDVPGEEKDISKSYTRWIMLSAYRIFRHNSQKIKSEIPFDLTAFSTRWSRTEPNRFRAMLRKSTQGPRGKPGRRQSDINIWVRQEIQRGRNQHELFEEYLEKRGIDPSNEIARENAKEAFRKVLSRTKRT